MPYYNVDNQEVWTVIIRVEEHLQPPSQVTESGYSLGRPFLANGPVLVRQGDAIVQGWSGRPSRPKRLRAWAFVVDPDIDWFSKVFSLRADKKLMREMIRLGRCHMPAEYLNGRGELAGAIRMLHALRGGMTIQDFDKDY